MQLYKTTINPIANFATPLQGDTLFGQLCWSIRYLFGEGRLIQLLSTYSKSPFVVIGDGFPLGHLPKPKLPSWILNEGDDKKQNRKKIWISPHDLENGKYKNTKTTQEAYELEKSPEASAVIIHNSINYQSFTTGEGFDPYGIQEWTLLPKEIYVLIDEQQTTLAEIQKAFSYIGESGYGKDSTVGKGRFENGEWVKMDTLKPSTTYLSLNAFTPNSVACKNIYYDVVTKFGKKGGQRANENPFKKPILMASTGSVIIYDVPTENTYIGSSIQGHTSHADIVHQGYAVLLPMKELKNE